MYGVSVVGFEEVYRALRQIEGGLPKEVRKRLRSVGRIVADEAEGNAPRQSGALASSLKVSLSAKAASVYSTSAYGGAQNVGAWSKGPGPHISRGNASQYMNRAVDEKRAQVLKEMNELMNWVQSEFSKY